VNRPAAARLAWTICTLALALTGLGVMFLILSASTSIPPRFGFRGSDAVFALAFSTVGSVIASRRAQNPVGWLFCAAGLGFAVVEFAGQYGVYAVLTRPGLPLGPEAAWVTQWVWPAALGAIACVFLLFPDGRLPSPRWRPMLWLAGVGSATAAVGFALAPGPLTEFAVVHNPFDLEWAGPVSGLLGAAGMLGLGIALLAAGAALVLRSRRAQGEQRQQLKWVTYAAALAATALLPSVVSFILYGTAPTVIEVAVICGLAAVPVASAVAILRYRLYDIDLLINRSLVYGALTATVVGVYVLVVGWLGAVFRARGSLGVSLLAAGVVAVGFQPLRERLQRGVDRLLYGQRDDPYAVLARLGQHLQATLAPEAGLPGVVDTLAQALKLPYAAVELRHGDHFQLAANVGRPVEEPVRLPLVYQREVVGRLVVAPRGPDEAFSPADQRLLADVARHAGVAAHAVRLTAQLQHSRQQLVSAREEERRRLRRDLHDGLGTTLAGVVLQLGAAKTLVGQDLAAAQLLLDRLRGEVQQAILDIRRLVYQLRPPALDELGLVGALREQATDVSGQANFRASGGPSPSGGPLVGVDAPAELPPLPAAVEVAAYRIATEALANSARHQARTCTVRLALGGALELEVCDDGRGMPDRCQAESGLRSMRERADELGGTCTIRPVPGGGTRVHARLPLPVLEEA
jgi:two-component system NarL family sensor kinase